MDATRIQCSEGSAVSVIKNNGKILLMTHAGYEGVAVEIDLKQVREILECLSKYFDAD